jgi:methionyl-tRNA formyltransferase
MRFVLVAEESIGIRALRMLHASAHTVVAVMTLGKVRVANAESVQSVAESLGLRTMHSKLVKDPATADFLRHERVDVLLNVYSMFQVCPEVIAAAAVDAFNLHPGRLPDVAGRNPVSAALYSGHDVHGVTLHQMTAEFDEGTIAFDESFRIEDRDTAGSLSLKAARAGERLLARFIEATQVGANAIPRRPQDHARRVYFDPAMPQGGVLDWSRPARNVVDFVRAYDFLPFASQWGHPVTHAHAGKVEIARARRTGVQAGSPPGTVSTDATGRIVVAAADEWVVVERVRFGDVYRPAGDVLKSGETLR